MSKEDGGPASLADDLRAAKALIADEAHWVRGGDVDVAQGRYCAAVTCNDFRNAVAMFDALSNAIPSTHRSRYFGVQKVFDFNDHPLTTHADILALFDRAIATAEAQQ